MKTYCIKCRKDTEKIHPKIVRTKNNRLVMQYSELVFGSLYERVGQLYIPERLPWHAEAPSMAIKLVWRVLTSWTKNYICCFLDLTQFPRNSF